jgi:hypothetical protein
MAALSTRLGDSSAACCDRCSFGASHNRPVLSCRVCDAKSHGSCCFPPIRAKRIPDAPWSCERCVQSESVLSANVGTDVGCDIGDEFCVYSSRRWLYPFIAISAVKMNWPFSTKIFAAGGHIHFRPSV